MLRQCVWFNLSVHLVSRGLEFQGGLSSDEALSDKKIYAVPKCPTCHVTMLRLLLSKTDQHAINLFNDCVNDALIPPSSYHTWYPDKPLQKQPFRGYMWDICKICKYAKCQIIYIPHCLRATAISSNNDAGFQARHIMFMSGHRCKASL